MTTIEFETQFSDNYFAERVEEVLLFALKNIENIEKNSDLWFDKYQEKIEWLDKISAESALLVMLLSRPQNNAKTKTLLEKLANLLSPLVRSEHYYASILKNPQYATIFGLGHIALQEYGLQDPSFDFSLKKALNSEYYKSVEKVPYRHLDNNWLLHIHDRSNTIVFEEIENCSILTSKATALYTSREDCYALTHTIFYITDFGKYDIPNAFLSKIQAIIDSCILWATFHQDLDLLGEFLICVCITNLKWSHPVEFGWKFFFKRWENLGFLYGPSLDAVKFATLEGQEAEAYLFQNIYHTYYVGGILCSVAQGRNINSIAAEVRKFDDYISKCLETAKEIELYYQNNLERSVVIAIENHILAEIENSFPQNYLYEMVKSQTDDSESLIETMENDKDKQATIFRDALLINSIRDYDIISLLDLFNYSIKTEMTISNILLDCLDFIFNQQLITGEIGVWSIKPLNKAQPDHSRLYMNLKISIALKMMSKYLLKVQSS